MRPQDYALELPILGFRVQDLQFGVQGLECRVLGFRVFEGFEFKA